MEKAVEKEREIQKERELAVAAVKGCEKPEELGALLWRAILLGGRRSSVCSAHLISGES